MNMSLTALPLVSKLSKRVIRILGCNPGIMTLQGTNTYLIGTGKKRVLLDSGEEGTASEYIKLLKNVLEKENATVEHLVITHWHHDHIGGAKAVQELIKSHSTTSLSIWKLPRSLEDCNGDETGYSISEWTNLIDEQLIEVEGAKLSIKHTPGHTTDHACAILEEDKILFTGDCILGETSAIFENLTDYMMTLKKLLALNSKVIYPGHGPIIEDPQSRIMSYIDNRNYKEAQILQILEENKNNPVTIDDIVKILYKNTETNLLPAAAYNVSHHLQKLLDEKKVTTKDDAWFLV
ncbi:hypothetical protein PV328_010288 [Microctonus aethiopoides]|uniref:Beta-lactamase-like protein 2 homolog n=1 Tax=Microctonus aethiopoides TaxID=144406 RepID=A0AA39C8G8_9HYME|nr:hypothetical protein PV328_010288 [Microctonus aethiopoides]